MQESRRYYLCPRKYGQLPRKRPEKRLLAALSGSGGRNNSGHMTMRHRGGGQARARRGDEGARGLGRVLITRRNAGTSAFGG